jgi:hypothetical protein
VQARPHKLRSAGPHIGDYFAADVSMRDAKSEDQRNCRSDGRQYGLMSAISQSSWSCSRSVKALSYAVGLDPALFAGHSMRSGFLRGRRYCGTRRNC